MFSVKLISYYAICSSLSFFRAEIIFTLLFISILLYSFCPELFNVQRILILDRILSVKQSRIVKTDSSFLAGLINRPNPLLIHISIDIELIL